MATKTSRKEAERLPPKAAPRSERAEPPRPGGGPPSRGSRAEALELIFESAVRDREGFRHGVLGLPRHGKTYHLQSLVDQAVAQKLCRVAFVHDTKKVDVQYRGTVRENVAHLVSRPPAPTDSPVIILHPSLGTVDRPSVEDVAVLALQTARRGIPTCMIADEAVKAVTPGSQYLEAKTFGEIIREGSSQGCSVGWTTQDPASMPRELRAMCETYAVFRLQGGVLSYVIREWRLPADAELVITNLGRGEFILVTLEGWNGRVYGPR